MAFKPRRWQFRNNIQFERKKIQTIEAKQNAVAVKNAVKYDLLYFNEHRCLACLSHKSVETIFHRSRWDRLEKQLRRLLAQSRLKRIRAPNSKNVDCKQW